MAFMLLKTQHFTIIYIKYIRTTDGYAERADYISTVRAA